MTSEVFAPAKINLTLHITGQRADGYHLLDSLVVFADVSDRIWITPQDRMVIEITGPFADGVPTDRRNLIWQAAELAGVTAHVRLEKNLPHGAGIGGGSADAAAILRHFGVVANAESLGADVPVCLDVAPQRMRGIGEELSREIGLPDFELVLVNPGTAVPTGPVFNALTRKDNGPMPDAIPRFLSVTDMCDWLALQRNDLQAPACVMVPEINHALDTLRDAALARMSGSGGTCFGIYADGAEAAASRIRAAHPDWWVAVGERL